MSASLNPLAEMRKKPPYPVQSTVRVLGLSDLEVGLGRPNW